MESQNAQKAQTSQGPSTPSTIGEKRLLSTEGVYGPAGPPAKGFQTSRFGTPEQVSMNSTYIESEAEPSTEPFAPYHDQGPSHSISGGTGSEPAALALSGAHFPELFTEEEFKGFWERLNS